MLHLHVSRSYLNRHIKFVGLCLPNYLYSILKMPFIGHFFNHSICVLIFLEDVKVVANGCTMITSVLPGFFVC